MLFNSIEFAIFLPIVFILYWFFANKNLRIQNLLIVIVSYIFYGWWDWRFLSLIIFSSSVDYIVGISLINQYNNQKRKVLLLVSIIVNIGFLGFFKYYNFFLDSFVNAFSFFGSKLNIHSLKIILPVGISFYTFQTLSYSIDVYRKKIKPTKDFTAFFAFVGFFPQLVAGPIERATNLLPQFYKKRKFEYIKAVDGLRQILWGLFKKLVIADNAATHANYIFENYDKLDGSVLVIGSIYFAFQIYGDFSGYSDIAIGTARLFGFNLKINFSYPYFSRDIAEFWRRWHISLSSWFKDYLYIPIGGSRGSKLNNIRNVIVIFVVSGFWHGANWTFIIWGLLNAMYFIPLMMIKQNRKNKDIVAENSILPSIKEILQIILTFFLTCIAWIFFRADSIHKAFLYLENIFSDSLFTIPRNHNTFLPWIVFLIIIEWTGRKKLYPLEISNLPRIIRWSIYATLIILIFLLSPLEKQEFIYFVF